MSETTQIPQTPFSYRERVMGCWLGKAVGGTLGVPFEGQDGPLDISFYTPVPTEMLPNDDLDLQVVWACTLDKMATPNVDRHVLATAWRDNIDFPWDEYGVAIRNIRDGLKPPITGSYDNWFKNGMGAPIRSEIWACLAPGNPQLAAQYAYEDACVDHDEDGIWGEVFLAALESAAFEESSTRKLLDDALATLPRDSRVRLAVEDTINWWNGESQKSDPDWKTVRESIVRHHGHENFTDAPMNIAFTILGWLAGNGDFSKTICIANNCGKDTDCTAATAGSIMGILNPNCIGEEWLRPIGRDLVLSPGIKDIHPPKTLDGFTDLVLDLKERLNGRAPSPQTDEARADEAQNTEKLKFDVQAAFVDEMPPANSAPDFPADSSTMTIATFATLPRDSFGKDVLLLRYRVHLQKDEHAKVMVNTPQNVRVWMNGQFLFERDGGVMAPSFHRAPPNQSREVDLKAGEHELVVALARPQDGQDAQWVAGIGDAKSNQWIPRAFSRRHN